MKIRQYYAGIIGNILEHYDTALFGFLAPFLSPLFFPKQDPLTGLILTYGMMPLGILVRPLGSLFFGWIGDTYGRKPALVLSLGLMGLFTLIIGMLPTFSQVGYAAPILLALMRCLQGFCMAGESSGAVIFLLEQEEEKRKNLLSSLYGTSSIVGILLACGAVGVLAEWGCLKTQWRHLYWAGALTATAGLLFRLGPTEKGKMIQTTAKNPKRSKTDFSSCFGIKHHSFYALVRLYFKPICAIVCVAGFSATTYHQAITLMHGFIPQITSFTKADVMHINTALLIIDGCLLPCFGYLSSKFSKEKVMLGAALLTMLTSIPLFLLLSQGTWILITAVRILLIGMGVAFAAPLHAWVQELIPKEHRYTLISFATAIGSQLLGAPGPAFSLWIFQKTGWVFSPALYLIAMASLGFYAVLRTRPLHERSVVRTVPASKTS